MSAKPLSVTEIAKRIKEGLEALFPYPLPILGEVSNAKLYGSGHFYFTLKDDSSALSCVMWASSVLIHQKKGLSLPKDGDKVIVTGRVTSFPARGSLQLSVTKIEPYGLGEALLALEELKKKLASEGLFDPNRKRKIPSFPNKIAVIAGASSAALRDIVVNLAARWPMAEVKVFPSLVQGSEAPKDLLRALTEAKDYHGDTLIIGRGGGSSEDLSAFNDEKLVRALAYFPYPVISAVGHEIDFSLTDFVADLRVSTPTGAAVAATPDQNEVRELIDSFSSRLTSSLTGQLTYFKQKLASLAERPFFFHPESIYAQKQKELSELGRRFRFALQTRLDKANSSLAQVASRLEALNPYGVLNRGYSLALDESGRVLTSISEVKQGQIVRTRMKDGIMTSVVTGKENKNG